VKIVNGNGEVLRFGGEVMKNVAGFDLSRLQAGALGTLGILLEISLRVLPRPAVALTVRLEHARAAAAVDLFNRLAARPLPLSAAAWCGGETRIRLSGSATGLARARAEIAAAAGAATVETDAAGDDFWRRLRDHELPFFCADGGGELLRVSLPPASAWQPSPAQYQLRDPAAQLVDWGGAQRWLRDGDVAALRAAVAQHGGHVTRFRRGDGDGRGHDLGDGDRDGHGAGDGDGETRGIGDGDGDGNTRADIFHPLPAPLLALHRRIKRAFDPAGIFNPGRLHADF